MVKEIKEPVIKLSAADRKRLDALSSDIEKGKKAIEALKAMDVDVISLEEKLEWATTARDVLLKEFV